MSTPRGRFIALEGIDGSGKTTQCRLLAEYLRGKGVSVVTTREPGGTSLGDSIRELLLDTQWEVSETAEALLFAAGRAQHVDEVIRPELEAANWVVCDRYVGSTYAYQGVGLGFPIDHLREFNAFATGGIEPDLTIVLDMDLNAARDRKSATAHQDGAAGPGGPTPDAIEARDLSFHARVRQGYLDLAQHMRSRVVVLDGSPPVEDVHRSVVNTVCRELGLTG